MDLSMSLNCSANTTLNSPQMAHQLDQNYNADLLDAMSDMAEEQYQAMTETDPSDWEGVIYDDEDAP
jgi:hypothetical protein